LLPHSDVDVLFLFADAKHESNYKDSLSRIYLQLWDLKIRASATARTASECGQLDHKNPEFTVSLFDSRLVTGNAELFEQMKQTFLPRLLGKSGHTLAELVMESARERHHKYGNTIYHLEPNVKEGPGGLRDSNLATWLAFVAAFAKKGIWPNSHRFFDARLRAELDSASGFLLSVRCFLHYRHGRDDNVLDWEAQDAAAEKAIGLEAPPAGAAHWMREYFRNARSIHGAALQLLAETSTGNARTRLTGWRSRALDSSGSDRILQFGTAKRLKTPAEVFGIFERLALTPVRLGIDAQRALLDTIPALPVDDLRAALWPHLRRILVYPQAADSLRAMRDCGLLDVAIPEFRMIDALAVRDFFHRYTVDEHSFLAIETLHRLRESRSEWGRRFAELLTEVDKPELLFLALLLHDFGKGTDTENHTRASVAIATELLTRLTLEAEERYAVGFLIQNHLEMSAAMRRDIFDPKVVAALAGKAATPESLKMLTLLTYADISAVNPEAMTEWKAENLWHLYAATSNFLNRHVDEERLHDVLHGDTRRKFDSLPLQQLKSIEGFLEGLPQRYVAIYNVDQILEHSELASRLWQNAVQVSLRPSRDLYEFTIVTADRPFLFANLTGALSALGMEIVKANAFSNSAGIVVDSFYVKDRFHTLELNPSEHDRFKKTVAEVLRGERSLEHLMRARQAVKKDKPGKTLVGTRVMLDNESSTHSTLLEVVAHDRPGLLYRIAQCLAELNCNIEVALIDTEGQSALDVFYLTSGHTKLAPEQQDRVKRTLEAKLQAFLFV
jgi:[protein-PII] uridylyltransferase